MAEDTTLSSTLPLALYGLDPAGQGALLPVLAGHLGGVCRTLCDGAIVQLKGAQPHLLGQVRVVGLVVAIDTTARCTKYTIDDSTGSLVCILWAELGQFPSEPVFGLASQVAVHGRVSMYRNTLELYVKHITLVTDPHEELFHWLRAIHTHQTYLTHPVDSYTSSAARNFLDANQVRSH
ncbi:hypothetical protein IWQ62_004671 [Dispira parvispora]|uniref:CST complex subunit STN1 n=1 Tax=Dispira parvispora TaxID=1520584 RepID=A0A9W8AL66_9FUNG|nr:hypothetical protein IWQ62_004671 [Dispira parvispora]